MEINTKRIEDAIVADAVERLVGDDDIYGRVRRGVDERINKIFAESAEAKIRAAIDAAITDGFNRSYHRVDALGRPQGQPTTISEQLNKLVGDYWNQRVDRQGNPTENTYNSNTSRAEWLMAKICADDFQKEMKQYAVNVTAALKDRFRAQLHETVNSMLTELFHVRSSDDQNLKRRDASTIYPPETPIA